MHCICAHLTTESDPTMLNYVITLSCLLMPSLVTDHGQLVTRDPIWLLLCLVQAPCDPL